MSKLIRSLLASGLVVVGVAACGDDVVITPPPPPPTPAVNSVSVAPNPATVTVGGTVQMIASVNADATVATTVTWTTSEAAKATVSGTGLATGFGAGSVAITACSNVTGFTGVCGSSSLTVTAAPTATVTSVTVTPGAAALIVGQTVQLSASVQGANNPAQTVAWTPLNAAIASVNATGLVTAVANGTAVIRACSTLAGFTAVCGSMSVVVTTPSPATVSIEAVTWVPTGAGNCIPGPGPSVPVLLTNVRCQIEVNANVNAGDQVLSRLDVLIGGLVVASHTFPGTAPTDGGLEAAAAPVNIILSANTQQLRRPTGSATLFVPVIFNGNQSISLNLYTATAATPLASTATPVIMNNPDAALKNGAALTLVNNSAVPSFTNITGTWFTGSQTAGSIQYASFSTVVPSSLSFGSSVCGGSTSNNIAGTATTGITIGANWTCAAVEGGNTNTGVGFPAGYPTLVGPDGTAVVAATGFSNVGSAFQLPTGPATTESRWNMIAPGTAPTVGPTVLVDNKAPVMIALGTVAFNAAFDQSWVNASYNFITSTVAPSSSDAGTGVALDQAFSNFTGVCSAATPVTTGADFAETLVSDGTPDGWRICGRATDNIGNVSAFNGPSNYFGVDKVAPTSRLAGGAPGTATPLIAPSTLASVSSVANTTIFGDGVGALSGTLAVMPASDIWGLEALDTRSGFNQNAVAGFPSAQTLTRLAPLGATSCGLFTNPLGTVLSDTWVRSTVLVGTIDCLLGIGYYAYTGNVIDRAGNTATTISRNFAQDHLAAPALASIGASVPLYTAGAAAPFFVFGSDDLEIIEGDMTVSYPNLGLITATIQGITYPLAQINGTNPGLRWDALLNNIVTAGTINVPALLGRVDFTCTGAGAPYAACAAANGITPTAGQFNTVNTTNDGQSPDSVRAVAYDVANNASGAVAAGLLSVQTSDVAQAWVGADLITWSVISTGVSTIVSRHMASTSITAPYFDSVFLARADVVAATDIRICGTYPAPVLTDNGVNRFWTYTIATPAGGAQCAGAPGPLWYAIGIKGAAALVTVGLP